MRGAALLLLLLAGGCAEMRQSAPLPGPPMLGPATPDPARAAIDASQRVFANRAAGLAGRPAEAAEALARLEYLTAEIARNPRFAPLPESLRREMRLARDEARDALGVNAQATEAAVVPALLAAARALRAGDPARAAAALPAPLFRPGAARSVARLGQLGPLPQTELATGALAQEVNRLDTEGGWRGRATAEPEIGGGTFGQSSTITAGY